jgi:hypothetical protein
MLGLSALFAPVAVRAQDPVPPPPDTAQVAPPVAGADTLPAPDSVSADTIFYNLPLLDGGADGGLPVGRASGFATGVWTWDRDAIMASGAHTLAELFAEVPGLIALYGGDYGTPLAVSAFGLGGGGYRVFRDGFEVYPLEGGVVDLQHVGLAGISRVRLDRSMGAMTIELRSYRHDDGRPFSVIEAGTGDLDTNMFRGIFAEPTTFGGSIGFGVERVDTRGRTAEEGGNRTGSWARYQLHLRDRAGLAFEMRRMGSQTRVTDYASTLGRTDLTVRGRVEVVPGVVAEAYTGRSSLDADEAGEGRELWGGDRRQHGARLAISRTGLWARGEARFFGGDELPARVLDGAGGWSRAGWGGVAGHGSLARWDGSDLKSAGARAWFGPIAGVTLFGSWSSGTYGGRATPVLDATAYPEPPGSPYTVDPSPPVRTERDALRAGAALALLGVDLAAAVMRLETDAHAPLGLELDLGAPVVAGATRQGVEGWASLPTPLEGLRIEGSYQRWDAEGPYLPEEIYRGSFEFHRTYLESGNFELWASLGVRGHDPMLVFVADDGTNGGLARVPFYQNWYARVQARILTVRLFLGWENWALRRNLQSYPDRLLPPMRSFFGLRWDMWS